MIAKGVLQQLMPFHHQHLDFATFCVAAGNAEGLDAAPRGGPPGFVHVLNDKQPLDRVSWQ